MFIRLIAMFDVIFFFFIYLAKTKPATLENVVGESPPSGLSRQWGPQRTVELWRDPEKGLGISIISGKVDSLHGGIFIKNVLADSPAGWNGTLKRGDRILEVKNLLNKHVCKYNNAFVSNVQKSTFLANNSFFFKSNNHIFNQKNYLIKILLFYYYNNPLARSIF